MNAPLPLVLAIDIGTSSTRALLFDGTGAPLEEAGAQLGYSLPVTEEGAAEANAAELFGCVCRCLDLLTERLVPGTRIAGVGISTFAGNLLGIDHTGRPMTPLITYADTRSDAQVAELRRLLEEEAVHQRTGCRLHATYWPAQLRWLAQARPDWFKSAAQWITLGDYIQRRLLGVPGVSTSLAAWIGLLNRHSLSWDEELLDILSVRIDQLAPLLDAVPLDARLTPAYARRWPALAEAAWLPAVGDGATANLGSECATPARVALTVGTTSAMRVVTDEATLTVPDGLWCYRVDSPRALVGGAFTEGGNLFSWARRTLKLPADIEVLERAVAAQAPDGHGLTFLPLLGGERAPGWQTGLRGAMLGISMATTPEEILRAGLEGVALRIAAVYKRLTPLLNEDAAVVASGGALLHSPVWLQIMADALNRPIEPSPVKEASARGAALLALAGLGITPPPLPSTTPPILPDPAAHLRYQAAAERQAALYRWLTGGSAVG